MTVQLPAGMRRVNLLLGSWTFVALAFLYLPIVLLVVYSFNSSKLNVLWEHFTFKWYGELGLEWYPGAIAHLFNVAFAKIGLATAPEALLPAPPLIRALNNSLIVASVTTVLSVVLGTLGAWILYRYAFPAMRAINTLVFIPMIIPEIIMGISLLVMFATVNRLGNEHLFGGKDVMSLGFTTVIISHVTFCFPFVMIAVQARLSGMDPALEEAALDLGATPSKAFLLVIVPYLLPAIVSGAMMSFTLSLDELIVTYFTYSADSKTLPIEMYGRVKKGLDPTLNALSTLFILATVVLVVGSEYVRKLSK
jgi:spermidine/putrescine transport system permease protein